MHFPPTRSTTPVANHLQFTCHRCRFASLSSQAPTAFEACFTPTRSPRLRKRLHHRNPQLRPPSFSTFAKLSSLETIATGTESETTGDPIIRKTWGIRAQSVNRSKDSIIRDQLRAWSVQNEIQKAENLPDELPASGRITGLPSSLFIEASRNDASPDEEAEVLDEYDEIVAGTNQLMLEVGDLILYDSPNVRKQFALFLGMRGLQHQFLLTDGRWVVDSDVRVTVMKLDGFATAEEAAQIQVYLPKQPVLREEKLGIKKTVTVMGDVAEASSAPILRRIAQLKEDINNFKRDYRAATDSIYQKFSHQTEYVRIETDQLTRELLGVGWADLSNGAKMGLMSVLENESLHIQIFKPHNVDVPQLIFTPKTLTQQFEKVVGWAREYQECAAKASQGDVVEASLKKNPLNSFIDKARRLILKSRAMRSPTTIGSLGPSSVQTMSGDHVELRATGEIFSESDKMILEFLWNAYVREPALHIRNIHHSIGSLILRAIGAYPKLKLENKIGRLLLQELGSMAPWSQHNDESVIFPLPGRRGAHEAERLFDASEKLCEELGLKLGEDHFPFPDVMADLRKDLGSMEVFCVDKPSTRIVDDGFSIEPSQEHPGYYWIHCHVAHPSAYIGPDHPFSKRARELGNSLYTSRNVVSMLPWAFGEVASIGPRTTALTISTLLTEEGEVRDIKIFPSHIRNVISLERRAVDRAMGLAEPELAHLIVGSDPSLTMSHPDEPSEPAKEKVHQYLGPLNQIFQLMKARHRARQREVPDYPNFPHLTTSVESRVSFLEPYEATRLMHSFHYHGDPTIKVTANRYEVADTHDQRALNRYDVTTHVMLLAGESAGKWFRDRNIPAPFMNSLTDPAFPLSKLNSLKSNEKIIWPKSLLTSTPSPHVMLNVAQYMRLTSPLRRYTDLLSHFQADAYIRAEAEGRIAPGSSADQIELPFSKTAVDEYITKSTWVIKEGERTNRTATTHWTFQALFRAFHFKEAKLPEVWDFKVDNTRIMLKTGDDSGLRGWLSPFNTYGIVLKSEEGWENDVNFNEYLPVKIEVVDVTDFAVYVRAVGPPSPDYSCKGPVRIQSTAVNKGTEAEENKAEVAGATAEG